MITLKKKLLFMAYRVILMSIKIPDGLPAFELLNNENIFTITDNRLTSGYSPFKNCDFKLDANIKLLLRRKFYGFSGNSPLQVDNSAICIP